MTEEDTEDNQFLQECAEMIEYFKNKTYESIVKGIKNFLEAFKKKWANKLLLTKRLFL